LLDNSGGNARGEQWAKQGVRQNLLCGVRDVIDVVGYLKNGKFTSGSQLAIHAEGIDGAVLAAALAKTSSRDFCAIAVLFRPILDPLNTSMTMTNIPHPELGMDLPLQLTMAMDLTNFRRKP
jgi:protease II